MQNLKLLPCPFKHDPEPEPGSILQADLEVTLVPWAEDYTVLCTWCAACGPMKKTEEEAIAAWNSQRIELPHEESDQT